MKHKTTSALVTISQVATATGYKVFWGTVARQYQYKQDVGNHLQYRVTGLAKTKKYYFSAKAYNASAISPFSNEVAFQL